MRGNIQRPTQHAFRAGGDYIEHQARIASISLPILAFRNPGTTVYSQRRQKQIEERNSLSGTDSVPLLTNLDPSSRFLSFFLLN